MELALGLLTRVSRCSAAAPLVLPQLRTIICEFPLTVRPMLVNMTPELQVPETLPVTTGAWL